MATLREIFSNKGLPFPVCKFWFIGFIRYLPSPLAADAHEKSQVASGAAHC